MAEIKVTFGVLDAASGDVRGTAVRITSQLDELKRMLAPLVATWDGAAAEEYLRVQRQWDTSAANLATVLGQVATALNAANDSYRQVERANAARWR